MSISPIITFKAGRCNVDESTKPWKVQPEATQGYIYIYESDDLLHFCWRERNSQLDDENNLDLIMFPADGQFEPYEYKAREEASSKTNGRIVCLKFQSSSQRHIFWLQSKPQTNDAGKFSDRDRRVCSIVNALLQGEEINVEAEIAEARAGGGGGGDVDGDETMEDVQSAEPHGGSGGAGADATGGDIREEGAESREGGADGGRAPGSGPIDAAMVVQNFLNSLKGPAGDSSSQQAQERIYTTLPDLLPSTTTIPTIEDATPDQIDDLLRFLPPTILVLAQESAASLSGMAEPNSESASAAMQALSIGQKRVILKRVLRSPQFHQSLGSLTMALRDGGLPSIAAALGLDLRNGGMVRGGSVPLGGGDAVEAFVEGARKTVENK
ncbi:proteasome complex subunit Rpn13 ubiquitin receptor-domain-containing protein [Calycina marina]|uniref:Proteasome complex subunit Rpn13 ubiquitin receptor-domain-containing protein n=1 Tax=Calycina marina TaxID=1763456 RepID=A0A9P7YVW5_9HELO|nr:proteasome complex subunit Rpn13 ubiquitin receptor-domain-containing protein [Calycina marina]